MPVLTAADPEAAAAIVWQAFRNKPDYAVGWSYPTAEADLMRYFAKIHAAITSGNLTFLHNALRHDQHAARQYFQLIAGVKLPRSSRDTNTFLDTWIKS